MAKIICENATTYQIRESCRDALAVMCKPDCPICRGAGYTEAEVVEVDKLTSIIENSALDDEDAIQEIIKLIGRNNNGI